MKNIIVISILFFMTLACKAQVQIIPLEGIQQYLSNNNLRTVPNGAYIKDVNGLFDDYIGEWQATHNNRVYTFFITKEAVLRDVTSIRKDKLYIKYLVTELDGTIVIDTREEEGNSVFGDKFSEDLVYYISGFAGEKYKCGNRGDIDIKHVASSNPSFPQIQISLSYGGGVIGYNEALCGDFVLEETPLYPLSITPLILNRQ